MVSEVKKSGEINYEECQEQMALLGKGKDFSTAYVVCHFVCSSFILRASVFFRVKQVLFSENGIVTAHSVNLPIHLSWKNSNSSGELPGKITHYFPSK